MADRVLVVIGRTRHKMMLAELGAAADRGADFIEVRLDYVAKAIDYARLAPAKRGEWVGTVRRPADGGRFPGSEAERMVVLRQAIASGVFDWVDLETDIADKVPRYGKVKRIVSYHNLKETPADLGAIYEAMCKQNADVVKIAVTANTPDDCRRVLDVQRGATKPTVAFAMGEIGFPTRLLALKFGAPWVYCSFNRDRAFAPGLPTFDDLHSTYPARRVSHATKVYGLFGDPVSHSLSPALHNRTLSGMKEDAIYLPFRVPAGKLDEALKAYADVPVSGYSVTIPHKEAAATLARQGDDVVRACSAANTLLREAGGVFTAHNTDGAAARQSIEASFHARAGGKATLDKAFALILGAGGAARAIAHALHAAGALITVTSRTHDRAHKLAAEVGGKVVEWSTRANVTPCDIVVNCTPIGMTPEVEATPMHASFFHSGLIAFDTIYTPQNTRFVRDARSREAQVITGVDMFVRQAARQVELFTGHTPDIEAMRRTLRSLMSPLRSTSDDDES